MAVDLDPPAAEPPAEQSRWRWLGHIPRLLGVLALGGLVALLIYGVLAQSPDRTIDDSLSRNKPIAAPSYRLDVLRHGTLGPPLERKVSPALADGSVSPLELRGNPYALNIWP